MCQVYKVLRCFYSSNLLGASGGVASRRKPAKSWNTLVNEDAEKCGNTEAEKSTEK